LDATIFLDGLLQQLVDYSCNEYLKDHSNKHGLVTIDTHFPNSVSPNGGESGNKSNLTFTDLLKPKTETGKRWRSYLDLVAEGLNDLQQANVTVFYRPLHEMNGGWFWWGQQVQNIFIKYKNLIDKFLFRIFQNIKVFGKQSSLGICIRSRTFKSNKILSW
jgi:hypothetical protein